MNRQLLIVFCLLPLSGLLMGGSCSQDVSKTVGVLLTGAETPQEIAAKVDAAGLSRVQLWAALKEDKHLFTEEEWEWAQALHNKALDLYAEIVLALSSGDLPPVADVEVWLGIGLALNQGAAELLQPVSESLSAQSQYAWAVERARLRALDVSAEQYIANPNAAMYANLAQIGLDLGVSVATGGVL